jgi:hypothetical protein
LADSSCWSGPAASPRSRCVTANSRSVPLDPPGDSSRSAGVMRCLVWTLVRGDGDGCGNEVVGGAVEVVSAGDAAGYCAGRNGPRAPRSPAVQPNLSDSVAQERRKLCEVTPAGRPEVDCDGEQLGRTDLGRSAAGGTRGGTASRASSRCSIIRERTQAAGVTGTAHIGPRRASRRSMAASVPSSKRPP